MTEVPHAQFRGALAVDVQIEDPPGASLARALESALRARFDSVKPFDNWRDCGWVIEVQVNQKAFEVYFTRFSAEGDEWLLAAAPLGSPGFIGRLLGRKPIECASELRAIASEVHKLLSATQGVSQVRWFLGGPPEAVPKFTRPEELPWR
jgi:hypothetical protein